MANEGRQQSGQPSTDQGTSATTRNASRQQTETAGQEGTDRERSIERGREGRQPSGLQQRSASSPVYDRGGASSSPFLLMRRMAEDMDRIFQDFGFGRSAFGLTPLLGSTGTRDLWRDASSLERQIWSPQVETFRRGDKLVVRADLPGLRKEDVQVEVENDVLTLSGERREEHEEKRDDYFRSERSYGQFYRAIPLPEGVNADQCEASFKDGVLEVTLPAPKQEESRRRQIQIR
jgi:HSP20 family protein